MANQRDIRVKELSSNLLQMKFMRRSVLAENERNKEELFQRDDEHWVVHESLLKTRRETETLSSKAAIQNLRYGRLSFKGFNPAVERIMIARARQQTEEEMEEEKCQERQEEEDYAKEMGSLSQNIAKRFAKQRQQAPKSKEERRKHKLKGGGEGGTSRKRVIKDDEGSS